MGVKIQEHFSWSGCVEDLPTSSILGGAQARRATFLAKAAALAIEKVGAFEGAPSIVFGSCLGNFAVTLELLAQIREQDPTLSPIRFTNCVHHAPVSHVRIASRQPGFITAIAGGLDLCAVALLEGIALCEESAEDVVVVLGEEPWPDLEQGPEFNAYSGAVRLTKDDSTPNSLRVTRTRDVGTDDLVLPEAIEHNPAARLEHVIAFAREGSRGPRLIAPAKGGSWSIEMK